MGDKSKIEWCDATWNPIVGCSRVSAGCENCYAEKVAYRFKHITKFENVVCEDKPKWNNSVFFDDKALEMPLRWKKPRRIFVCSMGDLFHKNVPDEWIDKVFAIMALCPQHTFMVLTKRPERMREYFNNLYICKTVMTAAARVRCLLNPRRHSQNFASLRQIAWTYEGGAANQLFKMKEPDRVYPSWVKWPLPNLWLGVSVEDQDSAVDRIPYLLDTPAAVRFVSVGPLLGPIDLTSIKILPKFWPRNYHTKTIVDNAKPEIITEININSINGGINFGATNHMGGCCGSTSFGKLDWVIAEGETGINARATHPDWVRKLRDDCEIADVAFFFKQWGEWCPDAPLFTDADGNCPHPKMRIGKKKAGNLLDGKQHLEFPKIGGV